MLLRHFFTLFNADTTGIWKHFWLGIGGYFCLVLHLYFLLFLFLCIMMDFL